MGVKDVRKVDVGSWGYRNGLVLKMGVVRGWWIFVILGEGMGIWGIFGMVGFMFIFFEYMRMC